MSEPSTPSFQGMCHFIGQLSKASKTGMRAALADCPKCHFNMLEGLLHAINCHGKDGAIYVSDLARLKIFVMVRFSLRVNVARGIFRKNGIHQRAAQRVHLGCLLRL